MHLIQSCLLRSNPRQNLEARSKEEAAVADRHYASALRIVLLYLSRTRILAHNSIQEISVTTTVTAAGMVQNSALDPIRGSGIHMAFFFLFEGWFRDPPNVLAYSITDQQEESRGLIVGWDEIHVSTKSNIGWRPPQCLLEARARRMRPIDATSGGPTRRNIEKEPSWAGKVDSFEVHISQYRSKDAPDRIPTTCSGITINLLRLCEKGDRRDKRQAFGGGGGVGYAGEPCTTKSTASRSVNKAPPVHARCLLALLVVFKRATI
ncbi:hypothetical protein MCOR02_010428 [Pyricularia oryzae]|nr:hypothetical protein MCOR02_010428 [Pyricularia oryzae]